MKWMPRQAVRGTVVSPKECKFSESSASTVEELDIQREYAYVILCTHLLSNLYQGKLWEMPRSLRQILKIYSRWFDPVMLEVHIYA